MEILSWGIGLPIQLQRCCAPGDEHHPCIFCMWSSKIMMKIDENWWKLITSWWNIMISMMKYHVVMKFVPSVNIRNPKKIPLPLGLQELATCFDHFDLWKSVQWEIPVVFRCPNCECRHVTGAWDSRTLLGSTPLELRFPSTACKLLISEGFIWIYMDLYGFIRFISRSNLCHRIAIIWGRSCQSTKIWAILTTAEMEILSRRRTPYSVLLH